MKPEPRHKRRQALRSRRSQERELTDGLAKMRKAIDRLTKISSNHEKRVILLERVVDALSASSDILTFNLPSDRKPKHMNKRT
jgi:hypothetical protein